MNARLKVHLNTPFHMDLGSPWQIIQVEGALRYLGESRNHALVESSHAVLFIRLSEHIQCRCIRLRMLRSSLRL